VVVSTLQAPDDLRAALADVLDGLPPSQAAQAVDRLIANYRGRTPTNAPILRDHSDVAAYAAYRMPATYAAVRSVTPGRRARTTARSWTGPPPLLTSAARWPGAPAPPPYGPPSGVG